MKSKPNSCSGLKPSPTGEVLGLKWNLRPLFLPTSCIPASHVMCGPLDPSTSYLSTWLPLSPLPAGFTPRTLHQLILLINTPGRPFFTSLPPQLLGPDYVRDPSFLLPEYLHLDSSLLHLLTNNSLKNTTLCKAQRPGAKPERREERGVPTRHRLLVSPGGTHREVFSLPCPEDRIHQGTAPWGGGGWALNTQPPEEGVIQGLRKCSHLNGQTRFLKMWHKDHLC